MDLTLPLAAAYHLKHKAVLLYAFLGYLCNRQSGLYIQPDVKYRQSKEKSEKCNLLWTDSSMYDVPTVAPGIQPNSSATRLAIVIAATRRGCVTAIDCASL